MKIEKIREALHAQPFRPFWIHLADDGQIPVAHEDFVALEPAGREIVAYLPDNTHHIVDMMLGARLESRARNGATQGKKH